MRMTTTIHAVYAGGMLRPKQPLNLAEGTEVEVIVIERPSLSAPDPRKAAQALLEIAALPIEGDRTPFSGEDHDKILYGEQGAR